MRDRKIHLNICAVVGVQIAFVHSLHQQPDLRKSFYLCGLCKSVIGGLDSSLSPQHQPLDLPLLFFLTLLLSLFSFFGSFFFVDKYDFVDNTHP
jgi:hypothetical protein